VNAMKKILSAVILVVLLVLTGCNAIENLSNSGTRLIINAISGADDAIIKSDVVSDDGGVFEDIATLTLNAVLINSGTCPDTVTHYNDVMIDRIDVRFTRTDGRNQPLVDVPLAFSVPVTLYVSACTMVEYPFILIRHSAKLEPPLRDLRELGQEQILVLVAHITVYSHDLAGNRLEPATGWCEVHCANFADSD